ncbi:hypothetical protein BJ742DRAFT_284706 [Cladochytrium replicatum]|nr:hypothetical protein BJ742DRAFT_284706 [Cladochytrium replicatum]
MFQNISKQLNRAVSAAAESIQTIAKDPNSLVRGEGSPTSQGPSNSQNSLFLAFSDGPAELHPLVSPSDADPTIGRPQTLELLSVDMSSMGRSPSVDALFSNADPSVSHSAPAQGAHSSGFEEIDPTKPTQKSRPPSLSMPQVSLVASLFQLSGSALSSPNVLPTNPSQRTTSATTTAAPTSPLNSLALDSDPVSAGTAIDPAGGESQPRPSSTSTRSTGNIGLGVLGSSGAIAEEEDIRLSVDGRPSIASSRVSLSSDVGTPELDGELSPKQVQEKLQKLKRYETRFADLARAYKALQRKTAGIESVLKQTTPFESISSAADLESLSAHMSEQKTKLENSESGIKRLNRQVNELKEIQHLETVTKAELFNTMQAELQERDDQIKYLKGVINALQTPPTAQPSETGIQSSIPLASPLEPETSPASAAPTSADATLRVKVKEMAKALKSVTEQRNKAIEKCKQLEEDLKKAKEGTIAQSAAPVNLIELLPEATPPLPSNDTSEIQVRPLKTEGDLKTLSDKYESQTAALQKQIDEHLATIDDLENMNSTLKERMNSYAASQRQLKEESRTLKEELSSRTSDAASRTLLEERIKLLTEEKRQAARQLEETRAELSDNLQQKDVLRAELEAKISQLEKEVQTRALELLLVNEDVEATNRRAQEAYAREEAERTRALEAEEKLEKLISEQQLEMTGAVVVVTTQDIATSAGDGLDVQAQIAELSALLASKQAECGRAYETIAMMEQQKAKSVEAEKATALEAGAMIEKLKSAQRHETASAVVTPHDVATSPADGRDLRSQIAELSASLASKQAECDRAYETIAILERRRAKSAETIAAVTVKAAPVIDVKSFADMEVELLDLRRLASDSQARAEEAGVKLSALNEQIVTLMASESALPSTAIRLAELEKERDEGISSLARLQRELDLSKESELELSTELKALAGRVQSLNLVVDDSSSNNQRLQAELDQVRSAADRLRATVQDLENENTSLKTRLESLSHEFDATTRSTKGRIHALEKEATQLIASLDAAKRAHAAAEKSATEAIARSSALEAQLSSKTEEHTCESTANSEGYGTLERQVSLLETDMAVLEGEKLALDAELQDIKAELAKEVAKSEEQVKTLEEPEKTRVNLEGQLKHIADMLTVAKETIHTRDETVIDLNEQMKQVKAKVQEEEEKKNKSIQLLRNSKTRILKLEADNKALHADLEKSRGETTDLQAKIDAELKEKDVQIAALNQKIEEFDHQSKSSELGIAEAEKRTREASVEVEKLHKRIAELREAELASVQSMMESQAAALAEWPARYRELEERATTLEQELETSKRLFQTKSIENDQLKLKHSELEAKIYNSEQTVTKLQGDMDQMKREQRDARKEVQTRLAELRRRELDLSEMRKTSANAEEELQKQQLESEREKAELLSLQIKLRQLQDSERLLERKCQEEESRSTKLKEESQHLEQLYKQSIQEREKILEDTKVRETQLRNVNKALKDELRKVSRAQGSPMGITGPDRNGSYPLFSPSGSARTSTASVAGAPSATQSTFGLASLSPQDLNTSPTVSPVNGQPPALSEPRRLSMGTYERTTSAVGKQYPHGPMVHTASSSSSTPTSVAFQKAADLPNPQPEYLKQVVLKYLESKDKRAQLLPVIAMLLKFTPEELRRVQNK